MGWEIKIRHETAGERVRLFIEASPEVPDDVISHVTGVYWADEVQGYGDAWEEANPFDVQSGNRIQG